MDIQKVFAEVGRLHLEIMQLNEQIAVLQAKLPPAPAPAPEEPKT
jgi:hypothetical protein